MNFHGTASAQKAVPTPCKPPTCIVIAQLKLAAKAEVITATGNATEQDIAGPSPSFCPKDWLKKAEQKRSHGFNSFQVCASAQQAIVSLPPLQHQTFSSLIPRLKLSQILTEQPLSKNTEAVA
ncbi:MAG TPA: hypothetical protein QF626_01330 [Prochlorococcaceae cyanobacterium Fu_MAG_50]|nr:hypothetical protein [Prochlorococcaceae cyanobacterium Fu_MAG_50]